MVQLLVLADESDDGPTTDSRDPPPVPFPHQGDEGTLNSFLGYFGANCVRKRNNKHVHNRRPLLDLEAAKEACGYEIFFLVHILFSTVCCEYDF